MRFIILIFCLLLLAPSIRAQTLSNLDRKFGIKSLRLETDISLYRPKLKLISKSNDGKIAYEYSSADMANVLDLPVQDIGVIFYKGKLYCISVIFKKVSDMEEKELHQKLSELFGQPRTSHKTDNSTLDYEWGYQWETEKVFMQFSKYSSNSSVNAGQLDLFMYSNKIHRQISDDNF